MRVAGTSDTAWMPVDLVRLADAMRACRDRQPAAAGGRGPSPERVPAEDDDRPGTP